MNIRETRATEAWVPHKTQVWQRVPLLRIDESTNTIKVKIDGEEVSYSLGEVHLVDASHLLDLDDLCEMNNLHEAPLLSMLQIRFMKNKFYTATGNVLISINPYQKIAGVYDNPLNFLMKVENEFQKGDYCTLPHIYRIANNSLTNLSQRNKNQSVIISGESGSGKTEASKYVMQFLIAAIQSTSDSKEVAEHIKTVLLDSNVIFEAFGNSKTVRNDNSSRFGKYIKLQYSEENHLISAFTETFLLEKSRLSYIGQGERNYHIFYQMVKAFVSESRFSSLRDKLFVKNIQDFNMLTMGKCLTLYPDVDDDIQEFHAVEESLDALDFSKQECEEMWTLLASILHLVNIICKESASGDAGEGAGSGGCIVESPHIPLSNLAQLLGVSEENFIEKTTVHVVKVARMADIRKTLKVAEVQNNVLALAKWLYSALFAWIVRKVNYCHNSMALSKASHDRLVSTKFIGILDIFGFEILGNNSFEQLCINFTNERLQQQFNDYVFVKEQEVYEREGLDWTQITYQDNQHVIDLISRKPTGLLPVLEEYGMLNRKPDDRALLSSYHQTWEKIIAQRDAAEKERAAREEKEGKNPDDTNREPPVPYAKPRFGNSSFLVKHFAGDVEYQIDGFIVKNNDSLQEDIMELLNSSTNSFLLNITELKKNPAEPGHVEDIGTGINPFLNQSTEAQERGRSTSPVPKNYGRSNSPPPLSSNSKMAASSSVSLKFRSQLDELMGTLRVTSPHYVKCIKPNSEKAPSSFNHALIMQQLRYSGIIEVVRIRREGFPQRCSFEEFVTSFINLIDDINWRGRRSWTCFKPFISKISIKPADEHETDLDWREEAIQLASAYLYKSEFQAGNSQLFLKEGSYQKMISSEHAFYGNCASIIQSWYKMLSQRRRYHLARKGLGKIQAVGRGFIARCRYRRQVKAARKIQYFTMGKYIRKRYLKQLKAGKKIHHFYRGVKQRSKYVLFREAVIILQAYIRRRRAMNGIVKKMRKSLVLQKNWRRYAARNTFKKSRSNVIRLQSWQRQNSAKKRYSQQRAKIILLQSLIRKALQVSQYNRIRQRCIVVQSLIRSHQSRVLYQKQRQRIFMVQALIRRFLQLLKFQRQKKAAIVIQKYGRRKNHRQNYGNIRRKCIHIQAVARMRRAYLNKQKCIHASTKIEKVVRRFVAFRKFVKAIKSAVLIQSQIRKCVCRIWYKSTIAKIIRIQTSFRRYLAKKRYLASRNHVILLQSLWRKRTEVSRYRDSRESIIILQSLWRRHASVKRYRASLKCAIRVQSLIRRLLGRIHYIQTRNNIIKIQSLQRKYANHKRYHSTRKDVILAQKLIRRYLCKVHYQKQRHAFILTQSLYRQYSQRKKYQSIRNDVIKIQSTIRQHHQRKRYRQSRQQAIKIENVIRRYLRRKFYLRVLKCCRRLQRAIRSFLHNKELDKDINKLCRIIESGDLKSVQCILAVDDSKHLVKGVGVSYLRSFLSVRLRKKHFCTPLHLALQGGHLNVIKTLMPCSGDILAIDSKGNTGAHYAAQFPSPDVFELLAEAIEQTYSYEELTDSGLVDENSKEGTRLAKLMGKFQTGVGEEKDDSDDEDTSSPRLNVAEGHGYENYSQSDVAKEGWLKKRRQGGRWQKRWTVLFDNALCYYKKKGGEPKGIIPIQGSTIRRLPGKEPIFDIENDSLKQKSGHVKIPVMEFMADNEKEVQEWLLPLRALAGTGQQSFRTNKEINCVNVELRRAWLSEMNHEGDTPLHILAQFRNRSPTGGQLLPTSRILQLAMWLIDNGCPIDVQNKQGQTALHIALRYGNKELANCLVGKGADTSLKNVDGRSVMDLVTDDIKKEFNDLVGVSWQKQSLVNTLNLPRLKGYTYITLHFKKHSQSSTDHRGDFDTLKFPALTVSVYNCHRKQIEKTQDLSVPVVRRSNYVWWACVWHMHTPIENLEDGCYIVIELKNYPTDPTTATTETSTTTTPKSGGLSSFFGGSKTTAVEESPGQSIAWCIINLDTAIIDSGALNIEFFRSPVVYPPKPGQPASTAPNTSDCTFLECDLLLTKRSKQVQVKEYAAQPAWVHHFFKNSGLIKGPLHRLYHDCLQPVEKSACSEDNRVDMCKLFDPRKQLAENKVITKEEVETMSVKELKGKLAMFKVDASTCVEKSDLKRLLLRALSINK